MTVVDYSKLEWGYEAYEDGSGEIGVYVSKLTGEIVCDGEPHTGDPCPVDNIEENADYVHLPSKYNLDLGKVLVMDFADTVPDQYDEIRAIFSSRGAYGRFRSFLTKNHLLDQWYAFEERKKREALVGWCKENDLEVSFSL